MDNVSIACVYKWEFAGKARAEVMEMGKGSNRYNKPLNSSMAANEKEIINLGKQMENLRTNQELKKYGEKPDPLQDEKNS